MREIHITPRYQRALGAVLELLTRLRLDFLVLGNVAHSAWLGGDVDAGSIDVLATMGPQQKSQVAMMASNRGFRVEREEIDASEELDVIPLHFLDPDGEIRVHVLLASNALYGRMVAAGVDAGAGERLFRIPAREDYALLLAMMGDQPGLLALAGGEGFDRNAYNDKLISIGLGGQVLA